MKKILFAIAMLFATNGLALEAFELPIMNGEGIGATYKSVEHPNSIMVLEAFFYACPYCHQNASNINDLATEFADQSRVQVLDVGRDCRSSDYRLWVSETSPNHPVLKDCSRSVISELGIRGYPTTVIFDCNGEEAYRHVGSMGSRDLAEMKAEIRELLTQVCQL
jgi:peroxiredoxin